MDFKNLFIESLASFLIVFRRFIFLITTPYKTLRRISFEKDYGQIFIILFFVFIYFQLAAYLKKSVVPSTYVFLIFLDYFLLTNLFFYFFARLLNKNINLSSFLFTFTYSLLPTLIWFIINSVFYFFLPPPRSITITGKIFSILFIAFSISLFIWKMILVYLSLRFSTKLGFYKIIYFLLLYLCIFIPYSMLLYQFKIFRIPFI